MANLSQTPKKGNRFGQEFTLWPLALTFAALIWICLGLNHFSASKDIPNLYCESELYFQQESMTDLVHHSKKAPIKSKTLVLNLSHLDDQVVMIFKYFENEKLIGSMSLNGQFLGLEVASVTYKLLLNKQDVELMIERSQLPDEIQRLIASEPSTERGAKQLPIDIQMLEFNPETGHGILQLKPSNNLWSCRISA